MEKTINEKKSILKSEKMGVNWRNTWKSKVKQLDKSINIYKKSVRWRRLFIVTHSAEARCEIFIIARYIEGKTKVLYS